MTYINVDSVRQQDGQAYTKYQGTASQTSQTYVYRSAQDNVSITNLGFYDITVVVAGVSTVITQNRSALFTSVSQFSITVAQGKQDFMAESWLINSSTELTKVKLLQYSGMRRWLYAVSQAKRLGTSLSVVCALDSLTAGAGNSGSSTSYVDYLRPKLQNILGNGGLGFLAFNGSAVANEFNGNISAFGYGGAPTQNTNSPFSAVSNQVYDPNLWSLDFASTGFINLQDNLRVFTRADLYYILQPSGGTFKFGDGNVTVSQISVATANAAKSVASTSYTSFPAQVNNLMQVSNIVGPNVHIMGADFRNGSTGVRVHRLAQGGSLAQQWGQMDAAGYTAFLQGIGCDLYILNAGMNDRATRTAAQYDTDIRAILTRVRNANPNGAILLIGPNDTSDGPSNVTLDTYRQKLQIIAYDYEALFVDNRWVMGTYANANANGWMFDGIHPSGIANQLLGNAIFNALGGNYLANIDSLLLN